MRIDRADWPRLPLALRKRWWRETDYSKKPPSPELQQRIKEALDQLKTPTKQEPKS